MQSWKLIILEPMLNGKKKLTAQGAGYWTETAYSYVNACVKIWKEKQKKKKIFLIDIGDLIFLLSMYFFSK